MTEPQWLIQERFELYMLGERAIEEHTIILDNLDDVKAYIKSETEAWEENAEENDMRVVRESGDGTSYAYMEVKNKFSANDTFRLTVKPLRYGDLFLIQTDNPRNIKQHIYKEKGGDKQVKTLCGQIVGKTRFIPHEHDDEEPLCLTCGKLASTFNVTKSERTVSITYTDVCINGFTFKDADELMELIRELDGCDGYFEGVVIFNEEYKEGLERLQVISRSARGSYSEGEYFHQFKEALIKALEGEIYE